MSSSPYKRRRASMVRNLWVYRRLIAAAMVLGLMLWFIVINNDPVNVEFPFGLGMFSTRSGVAILLGALAGSIVTALTMTLLFALRRRRLPSADAASDEHAGEKGGKPSSDRDDWGDDRPPPDYASRTPEGFSDAPWSAR